MISLSKRVDHRLIRMWEELYSLVKLVKYENDRDAIILSFQENGQFSVQWMYKTIDFRRIQVVYTPTVWHISVPPRIYISCG